MNIHWIIKILRKQILGPENFPKNLWFQKIVSQKLLGLKFECQKNLGSEKFGFKKI